MFKKFSRLQKQSNPKKPRSNCNFRMVKVYSYKLKIKKIYGIVSGNAIKKPALSVKSTYFNLKSKPYYFFIAVILFTAL